MHRQQEITARDINQPLWAHLFSAGCPALPKERQQTQPERSKGDPASVTSGLLYYSESFYERHEPEGEWNFGE